MYRLSIENAAGNTLELTGREGTWQVVSVRGLNPAPALLNMANIYGEDGARLKSAKLQTRNIVILLRLNGAVYANRKQLYDFFGTKKYIRVYFSNENRSVFADGYIETNDCDLFTISELMQISIICPNPYLQSREEHLINFSGEKTLFYFPFAINQNDPVEISSYADGTIYCDSDGETGMETAVIVKPDQTVTQILISNLDTNEFIGVNGPFEGGDKIIFDTRNREFIVSLIREGASAQLFRYLVSGSRPLRLQPGWNRFSYSASGTAESNAVEVSFRYRDQYDGV